MTNSAVPRTTSSMPSVTRKDGILSCVTNQPLTSPMKAATSKRDDEADLQRGDAAVEQRPHQHRREAEQRADREVEFARRHQQRHRQRDQAELDGEGQRVGDVLRRQEVVVDRQKTTSSTTSSTNGPNSGPRDQASDERAIFALSSSRIVRMWRRPRRRRCEALGEWRGSRDRDAPRLSGRGLICPTGSCRRPAAVSFS